MTQEDELLDTAIETLEKAIEDKGLNRIARLGKLEKENEV